MPYPAQTSHRQIDDFDLMAGNYLYYVQESLKEEPAEGPWPPLLGGSWVDISGAISPLISVISIVILLITPNP